MSSDVAGSDKFDELGAAPTISLNTPVGKVLASSVLSNVVKTGVTDTLTEKAAGAGNDRCVRIVGGIHGIGQRLDVASGLAPQLGHTEGLSGAVGHEGLDLGQVLTSADPLGIHAGDHAHAGVGGEHLLQAHNVAVLIQHQVEGLADHVVGQALVIIGTAQHVGILVPLVQNGGHR